MKELPIHYAEIESIYANTIGKGNNTVAVTSSVRGEGSTIISYALARRSAEAGRKTLLIDCNTHHKTKTDFSKNLSHSSENTYHIHDEYKIVSTAINNMFLLSFKKREKPDLFIREASRLKQLFKQLHSEYDNIIIDTSPLTAINKQNIPSDIVCSAANATILVALADKTLQSDIRESMQKLNNSGANIVGTVLNDRSHISLKDDMLNSFKKLERYAPTLSSKIYKLIKSSAILNYDR